MPPCLTNTQLRIFSWNMYRSGKILSVHGSLISARGAGRTPSSFPVILAFHWSVPGLVLGNIFLLGSLVSDLPLLTFKLIQIVGERLEEVRETATKVYTHVFSYTRCSATWPCLQETRNKVGSCFACSRRNSMVMWCRTSNKCPGANEAQIRFHIS